MKNNFFKTFVILFIICVLIFIIFIFYQILITNFSINTKEIDLKLIDDDEKEKIIYFNFLELETYPRTMEFFSLKSESTIREKQYYITFSVDKDEAVNYVIERKSSTAGESEIYKILSEKEKNIYMFKTNFSCNSRGYKWDFLDELLLKYE